MELTGTNDNFYAIWDETTQTYSVYKRDFGFVINVDRFDLVKNYIN